MFFWKFWKCESSSIKVNVSWDRSIMEGESRHWPEILLASFPEEPNRTGEPPLPDFLNFNEFLLWYDADEPIPLLFFQSFSFESVRKILLPSLGKVLLLYIVSFCVFDFR